MSRTRKLFERPIGTIINKIEVGNDPRTGAVLKMLDETFYPPRDRDLKAKPYKPKRKAVKVSVPEGLVEMAVFVARAQGTTGNKLMSSLLSEALHEVMQRIRRQWNEGLGKRQKVKVEDLSDVVRWLGGEDG